MTDAVWNAVWNGSQINMCALVYSAGSSSYKDGKRYFSWGRSSVYCPASLW
jgi:hypothetical protein